MGARGGPNNKYQWMTFEEVFNITFSLLLIKILGQYLYGALTTKCSNALYSKKEKNNQWKAFLNNFKGRQICSRPDDEGKSVPYNLRAQN